MSLDLEIYEANLFVRQTFLVTPHMGIPSGGHGFDEKCHKKNPLRKNRKNVFAANSNGGALVAPHKQGGVSIGFVLQQRKHLFDFLLFHFHPAQKPDYVLSFRN